MEGDSPCLAASYYLEKNEVKPINDYLPSGCASTYVPARIIKALFEDEPHGLTLERLFLCPCSRCTRDGDTVENRFTCFNDLRQQELRGDYASIYALLIFIHRPGLIRVFQKHEIKLAGTRYLCDSDFEVLRREAVIDLEMIQRRVIEKQYSFSVRTLKPSSDVTVIPSKELLPITEDLTLKGEGSFAEVRCFEFQHNEYRSREFGEV